MVKCAMRLPRGPAPSLAEGAGIGCFGVEVACGIVYRNYSIGSALWDSAVQAFVRHSAREGKPWWGIVLYAGSLCRGFR